MSTRDIVYIALFAALTCALGLLPKIAVSFTTVPITPQSLAVMLAGAIAGAKRGSLAMVLFLALVAIGLPVLSGGRGGIGVFLTASGGYLIGWVVGAFVIGVLYATVKSRNFVVDALFAVIGGIGVVYLFGIPWMAHIMETSLYDAIKINLAYIPGDLIKVAITVIVVGAIRKGDASLLTNR